MPAHCHWCTAAAGRSRTSIPATHTPTPNPLPPCNYTCTGRRWVNNCIGAANFRPFILMITSACALLLMQLGVGLYLLARCFMANAETKAALAASYPGPMVRV